MILEVTQYSDKIPLTIAFFLLFLAVCTALLFLGVYLTGEKTEDKQGNKYEHDDVTGDFNL
jgi:hypothetical protein